MPNLLVQTPSTTQPSKYLRVHFKCSLVHIRAPNMGTPNWLSCHDGVCKSRPSQCWVAWGMAKIQRENHLRSIKPCLVGGFQPFQSFWLPSTVWQDCRVVVETDAQNKLLSRVGFCCWLFFNCGDCWLQLRKKHAHGLGNLPKIMYIYIYEIISDGKSDPHYVLR